MAHELQFKVNTADLGRSDRKPHTNTKDKKLSGGHLVWDLFSQKKKKYDGKPKNMDGLVILRQAVKRR